MKKAKFLFLAMVVAGAFSLTSCGGEAKKEENKKEDKEKKDKDEESEFYDKDAVGEVIYFNNTQILA